ncbi:hypothetical protein Q1695_008085 [Nippostrongylus brasiliensis]|nr:hypothetical protein Q1695_008085 [Nippostrongylus brasiliensis]
MNSIALLCLLPVIAAYSPFNAPCGLSYEEGQAYKEYAAKVKYGLIFSCNLLEKAQTAIDTGYEPDLENGINYWVTTSKDYSGSPRMGKLLKEALADMRTNLDQRVKTYGCAYNLEHPATGGNIINVGCLFSRKTYYYR